MIYDYMLKPKEQTFITENYVSSPPALWIHNERGDVFTLGAARLMYQADAPQGEFAFEIMKNGSNTGTFASRIERRNGKIRAFTRQGWRTWTGNTFA
jgi:hypothetical protein